VVNLLAPQLVVLGDLFTALPRCVVDDVRAKVHERSLVIAEHEKRFDPGEVFGELRRYRKLVQGDAALSFYRRQ